MEKPNFILYGKVIALSQVQEIPSKEAGKPAIKKRELYLDCTRYDYLTGQQVGYENKPLLEFGGEQVIDKLGALALQKDDIVGVRFAIQGNPYKDEKTGKSRVFTAIRCYDIELVRRAGEQVGQQQTQQQAAPAPQPTPAPQPQVQQPVTQQNDDAGQEPLPF